MATEEKPGRQPLAPAVRRRLQSLYEHGTKVAQQGQFDYATDLYAQCLHGDPSNPIYAKAYLANLSKKYNNNKTGGKMAGMKLLGTRAAIKKSAMQKKWDELIKTGLDGLKENPWDAGILSQMGQACEHLGFDEVQIEYLKQALDADVNDEDSNRLLGRAYDRTGEFQEAIICFNRVLKAKGGKDEEALKAISNLAVKRTISKGGYEDATSSKDVRANKFRAEASDDDASLTPEERYLRSIQKDPSDPNNYIELNDIYVKDEKFDKCVAVMKQALEVTGGGNIMILERYEDAQLRLARQHFQIAEQKARDTKTPEAIDLYKRMAVELNNKETEIYGKRCERYPTNLGFKFELAVRLQKAGKFVEAIKLFQEARTDMKRKGAVLSHLGDCFYSIKQYRLSLQNYEAALPEIHDRDPEVYKGAIYKAARLAEHLKDWEVAEKHYNSLASHDFGYKDVAERLDNIRRIRENGGDPDVS
jgi:tetratricopeptide (TPR) repeat protein